MPRLKMADTIEALRAIRAAAVRRRDRYDSESSRYLELHVLVLMLDYALEGRMPRDPISKSDSGPSSA